MIHILDRTSRNVEALLRSMFEARKRVFVDLLGWDVPVVGGCLEIDQFDDEDAVYIVLTDEAGCHKGSARLLRTTRPHILGDLFATLCAGGVPRGEDVREITRFCLDRGLRAAERRFVRNQLVTAIAEYALAHGICRYTCVAELGWLQQILTFGWRCVPLGLPGGSGATAIAALAIEIDDETPQLLADAGIYALPASPRIAMAEVFAREDRA